MLSAQGSSNKLKCWVGGEFDQLLFRLASFALRAAQDGQVSGVWCQERTNLGY